MPSSVAVCVTEWCLWAVAVSAFSLRVFVRMRLRAEGLFWSDLWLLMALLSSSAVVVCDTITFAGGYLEPSTGGYPEHILKLQYATSYVFDTGLYFTKFSILAFYAVLVNRTSLGMRRALYCFMVIAGGFWIATIFVDTFWCGSDPAVNWIYEEVDECTVFLSIESITLNWSFQFATECLIFFFPFPIIWQLQINHRARMAIYCLLGLGVITIMTTVGRFIAYRQVLQSGSNDYRSLYIWATGEYATAIVVVSLAGCRPILGKIPSILAAFKRTIRNKTDSTGTDRTQTGDSGGAERGHGQHTTEILHGSGVASARMSGAAAGPAGWRLSAHAAMGGGPGVAGARGSTRLSGMPRHWIDVIETGTLFGDDDDECVGSRKNSRTNDALTQDEEWAAPVRVGADVKPGPSESEPAHTPVVVEDGSRAQVEPRPKTGDDRGFSKTVKSDRKE